MPDPSPSPEPDAFGASIFTPHRRTQFWVTLASVACFLLFWWAGKWIGIPAERGYEASLLQQHSAALVVFATYVLLACAVIIGSLISGRAWFFGGLFAAAIGLMALSVRGGPMRYALFHAIARGTGKQVFLTLFFEQCLLFAAMGPLWWFFWSKYEIVRRAAGAQEPKTSEKSDGSLGSIVLALAAQVCITGAVILLLAATDNKKQVLVSTFFGGFVGAFAAEYFFAEPKAVSWYWIGPFAAGAIGYLVTYFTTQGIATGDPGGSLAALARVYPLDYASAGIAGTMLGFWMAVERPEVVFSIIAIIATEHTVKIRHEDVAHDPKRRAS
jgi:hypothetical protein